MVHESARATSMCAGVLSGSVGQVGRMVMGQVVVVVGNAPHHYCDACDMSLLELLAASAGVSVSRTMPT